MTARRFPVNVATSVSEWMTNHSLTLVATAEKLVAAAEKLVATAEKLVATAEKLVAAADKSERSPKYWSHRQ